MPAIASLILLFSLLAVFKAPIKFLWLAAIAATEWGHFLAIAALGVALVSWRMRREWGAPEWALIVAMILYMTPSVRAIAVANVLPEQLIQRFGRFEPQESSRKIPLSWRDLFAGIPSAPVQVTTVVYATHPSLNLSMDIYQKVSAKPQPGVLIVHGGSWKSGERGEFSAFSRYLAARGYVVASIDYRLAPQSLFPAALNDVFDAIAYLKKNSQTCGLDAKRMVLLGRSAGGQIALTAAYSQKEPAIRGVAVFYTPNDLIWGYSVPANPLIMNSRKVIEDYLGGKPDQVPAQYKAASPLLLVNKTTPPTLMIHGNRDELVSVHHEDRLSERLTESGRLYFDLRLPWATHGCDANLSGPSGQLSAYAVERFLAAVTNEK